MPNMTFHLPEEIILTLKQVVPKGKLSEFAKKSFEQSLNLKRRLRAMGRTEEMRAIAKKLHWGTSEETVKMIRKMRESR